MQLKVKMQRPGYPFIQEKWITLQINERDNPEIRRLTDAGYHVVKAEVSL
jgi:hypothetical protein